MGEGPSCALSPGRDRLRCSLAVEAASAAREVGQRTLDVRERESEEAAEVWDLEFPRTAARANGEFSPAPPHSGRIPEALPWGGRPRVRGHAYTARPTAPLGDRAEPAGPATGRHCAPLH